MASVTSAVLFAPGQINGIIFKGSWDASSGAFPGAGAALTGWLYKVSVGGVVDGVTFAVGDSLYAVADNASVATFAANWTKVSATDLVQSVAGMVGAVTLSSDDLTDIDTSTVAAALNDVLKFDGANFVPAPAGGSVSGAAYAGTVANSTARLALPDSPGQTAWQTDGGSLRRGGMYQQIRTPATSNANWVLIGELLFDATWDGTITTFDSTIPTFDRTA